MKLLVGSPVGRIRAGAAIGQAFASGGGGGGSIAPDEVSGTLERWFKSVKAEMFQNDDLTTVVSSSGDPVGSWTDDSGNAAYLRQSTAGLKPTYGEISSLPVTVYDGSDDALDDGDGTTINFAETDPFTLFAIINWTTIPGSGYVPFLGKHDGTKGWHINSSLYANGKLGMLIQGSGYLEIYGNTTMSTGNNYAVVVVNTGASAAAVKMWVNGTAQTCTVNSSGGLSWGSGAITNTQPFAIGQVTYAVTAYSGKIGECGVYSTAISDSDAVGLSAYLTNLAGL